MPASFVSGNVFQIAWLSINYIVLVPIAVIVIFIYFKKRTHNFIYTRRPGLALIANVTTLFYISIIVPFMLIALIVFKTKYYGMLYLLNEFFVGLIAQLYLLRVWHLFYDLRWNKTQSQRIWKKEIAPFQTSFTIKYRNTLGSPKRTTIFVIIARIIVSIPTISIIITLQNIKLAAIISTIFLILNGLPIVAAICKLSRYNDLKYIREESLIGFSFAYTAGIINLFLIIFEDINHNDAQKEGFIVLQCVLASVVFFLLVLLTTMYVFWRANNDGNSIKKIKTETINPFKKIIVSSSKHNNEPLINVSSNIPQNNPNMVHQRSQSNQYSYESLQNLLMERAGFNAFMKHLVKEYALENLLFVVEVTQFFNHSKSVLSDNGIAFIDSVLIKLCDGLPESQILTDYQSFESQFVKLYRKYIHPMHAPWQINISSDSRRILTNLYRSVSRESIDILSARNGISPRKIMHSPNLSNLSAVFVGNDKKKKEFIFHQSNDSQSFKLDEIDDTKSDLQSSLLPSKNPMIMQSMTSVIQNTRYDIIEALHFALKDIWSNLNDSFWRFKRSDEGKKWLKMAEG